MKRHRTRVIPAVVIVALAFSAAAWAVVVQMDVTPASVKQNPKAFSVESKADNDGLIHFTITRHIQGERYVVASLTVSDGKKVIARSAVPAFVREQTAIYYVAIAPDFLADSVFEIADRSFGGDKADPVPLPGGTDFRIALRDFKTAASAQHE